jgi:hypothetical protein
VPHVTKLKGLNEGSSRETLFHAWHALSMRPTMTGFARSGSCAAAHYVDWA